MINTNTLSHRQDFAFIGWKSYNSIKKKAMEQEFSWSGLVLSLSIAFFIVLTSAGALNLFYNSIQTNKNHQSFLNQKIYHLESTNRINIELPALGSKYKKIIYPTLYQNINGFSQQG